MPPISSYEEPKRNEAQETEARKEALKSLAIHDLYTVLPILKSNSIRFTQLPGMEGADIVAHKLTAR
jgi:hypothetical protein